MFLHLSMYQQNVKKVLIVRIYHSQNKNLALDLLVKFCLPRPHFMNCLVCPARNEGTASSFTNRVSASAVKVLLLWIVQAKNIPNPTVY